MISTSTNGLVDRENSYNNCKEILCGDRRKSLLDYIGKKTEESGRYDKIELSHQKQRFTFYMELQYDPIALLDAVNFYEGAVSGGGSDGCFSFGSDGNGQKIPQCAVPRINVKSLEKLYCKNNILKLSSKSYYSYKASNGKLYACCFNGRILNRAFSEYTWEERSSEMRKCNYEILKMRNVISDLVQASGTPSFMPFDREAVKESLANVGIKPGEFKIIVDGKVKKYYLEEDGKVSVPKE